MTIRTAILATALTMVATIPCASSASAAPVKQDPPTFTLWQLPEQTHSQMMSYVIRTVNGKIIVIDGGMRGDAPYLKGFLAALGNKVDYWFITHMHDDHFGAVTEILEHPHDLKIGRMYGSMVTDDWMKQYGSETDYKDFLAFEQALTTSGTKVIEFRLGQVMNIDGVRVQTLGIANPEIHANCVNNSSVVLRVSDAVKSVIFLADLGFEGGEKLLKSPYAKLLHADYCQMAHHGQNGVGIDVYKAIAPKYCLWTTPEWLWENNIDKKGRNSGPWKTLEVRAWMEQLEVKKNYVTYQGLFEIR